MFSRGFMYERPMLGHNMFEALPVNYDLGQAAAAPPVVIAPTPPVIVTPSSPSAMATVGTIAVVGALGFFALELTGITHVLGLKKYMR